MFVLLHEELLYRVREERPFCHGCLQPQKSGPVSRLPHSPVASTGRHKCCLRAFLFFFLCPACHSGEHSYAVMWISFPFFLCELSSSITWTKSSTLAAQQDRTLKSPPLQSSCEAQEARRWEAYLLCVVSWRCSFQAQSVFFWFSQSAALDGRGFLSSL